MPGQRQTFYNWLCRPYLRPPNTVRTARTGAELTSRLNSNDQSFCEGEIIFFWRDCDWPSATIVNDSRVKDSPVW
jgi:hypothetical protein